MYKNSRNFYWILQNFKMLLLMLDLVLFSVVIFIPSVCIAKDDTISSIYNGASVKLVGGNEVLQDNAYSYVALLELREQPFCGSAIIGLNVLLTAGHCVHDKLTSELRLRAGTYVKGDNTPDKVQLRSVRDYVIHKDYEKKMFGEHDIALIFVSDPFTITDFVNVVKLATKAERDSFYGETVFFMGWGRTENGQPSNVLKHIELTLLKRSQCKTMLSRVLHHTMICAINRYNDQGSCIGDSGGPLVKRDFVNKGNDIMLGVASFMVPKKSNPLIGNPHFPSVFIDVVVLESWIKKVIDERHHPKKIKKEKKSWFKCC